MTRGLDLASEQLLHPLMRWWLRSPRACLIAMLVALGLVAACPAIVQGLACAYLALLWGLYYYESR